jgi:hypothetical protein
MGEGQVQSGQLESLVQRVVVFKYDCNPLKNNKTIANVKVFRRQQHRQ